MTVTLVGCGCGSLTREAQESLENAELLIGADRLLRQYGKGKKTAAAVTPEAVLGAIRAEGSGSVCILLSGDSGFYSGMRRLAPILEKEAETELRVLPGISSVQAFAARLRRPWQDWELCSAHGTDCDAVAAVCKGKPAFFLTGGRQGPAQLCRELADAGLDTLPVSVGENFGTGEERILTGTAGAFATRDFAPLSVLLAEAAPRPENRTPGLPDESFLREDKIPMTKQEVRAAALAKLGVGPEDVCWDIGAGTGSVAVELALQGRAVYAVEKNSRALELAGENRRKHGAWNLRLVHGRAPEALAALPKPDAVFVGGSGGALREILGALPAANPQVRICVAAVTLETVHETLEILRNPGFETEICQIAVSRGRMAGDRTLMTAQNPVWLISGRGK